MSEEINLLDENVSVAPGNGRKTSPLLRGRQGGGKRFKRPAPYKFPQMILSAVLSELAGTLSQHFLPPPCLTAIELRITY